MVRIIKRFLQSLSGVNPEDLARPEFATCRSNYETVGSLVLMNSIVAFGGAMITMRVFHVSWIVSAPISIAWALIVGCLDRYFVSSIDKRQQESIWVQGFKALPRLFMAVILALILETFVKIKVFQPEIQRAIVERSEDLLLEKRQELNESPLLKQLQQQEAQLLARKNDLAKERRQRYQEAIGEAEGISGSQVEGKGIAFAEKTAEVDRLDGQIQGVEAEIQSVQAEISKLKQSNEIVIKRIMDKTYVSGGILSQIAAIEHLGRNDLTMGIISNVITLFFIVFDTAPILTKLVQKATPYDAYLDLHERSQIDRIAKLETAGQIKFDAEIEQQLGNVMEARRQVHEMSLTQFQSLLQQMPDSPDFTALVQQTFDRMLRDIETDLRDYSEGIDHRASRIVDKLDSAAQQVESELLKSSLKRATVLQRLERLFKRSSE
jgi:Domain of unknown function (DUF4407)